MSVLSKIFVSLVALALFAGCDSGGGSKGGNNTANGKPSVKNRIQWSSIPSTYNPSVEDIEFRTDGYEKINVNVFGFDDDVEVVYSKDLPADTGFLRIYRVWAKSASWGYVNNRPNGTTLDLIGNGRYSCSIGTSNGQIVQLEGGCYVRIQVFMPADAQIEVYNVNKMLTKRFFAIKTDLMLEQLDRASRDEDKFAVIETYLASYRGLKKKPEMQTYQLGAAVAEFPFAEGKFKALRLLHTAVVDRENLAKMIEDKFSYFDREEARRIVGI
ncbi:DUF4476 domain-containing protein [Bdellovibrio bacteriovorus]|uniref:DUF4476 domain-containing protein n=1 Tax=Bdellovibrio bacteriovorus TaxID=959 RepID=UPI0035A6D0E4